MTLGDALLAPHRSYLGVLRVALDRGLVKALAHLTGGGVFDNLPRVLPEDCAADIERAAWPVLPLFQLIAEVSGLPDDELFRTFNMGVGLMIVCDPQDESALRDAIKEPLFFLGHLTAGPRGVRMV
jgi:phosphoribosylaminoimidazole (AIR) synthetase